METLYQKTKVISRVKKYFLPYIELLTKPSGHKLFLLLLAVLSMQAVTSIQHIYKWFLAPLAKISQNAYYYLLTYTLIPTDKFAEVTIRKAIGLKITAAERRCIKGTGERKLVRRRAAGNSTPKAINRSKT
jgi:hypothetical protein